MDFPFSEIKDNDVILRTFSPDVDSDELVWHKDLKDRKVTIVEDGGWEFQEEDKLPIKMYPNQTIWIPKLSWHRVIKGHSELKVEIIEFD